MPDRRQATLGVLIAFLVVLVVFLARSYDSYGAFKALHVAAAVVWVGGGLMLTMLGLRAERTNDPHKKAALVDQAAWAGQYVFAPVSVLVLALGFVLMSKSNGAWSYSSFWVVFGLIVWAVSATTGFLFFKPQTESVRDMIAERGADDAEVQERVGKILFAARIDMALLLLVVVDMTAKPFLG
jgi:uncharacterized membrane protein